MRRLLQSEFWHEPPHVCLVVPTDIMLCLRAHDGCSRGARFACMFMPHAMMPQMTACCQQLHTLTPGKVVVYLCVCLVTVCVSLLPAVSRAEELAKKQAVKAAKAEVAKKEKSGFKVCHGRHTCVHTAAGLLAAMHTSMLLSTCPLSYCHWQLKYNLCILLHVACCAFSMSPLRRCVVVGLCRCFTAPSLAPSRQTTLAWSSLVSRLCSLGIGAGLAVPANTSGAAVVCY